MVKTSSISFRDQTTGRINDLLDDEDQPCAKTQNLLGYLAGALLDYKDEGIELVPSILLCENISKFLRGFPGATFYKIGHGQFDVLSGPKILKDLAPLSNKSWFIYVERVDRQEMNYGVFTYVRLPTTISLEDIVILDNSLFGILIRKAAPNTIIMIGSKGSRLTFVFSTTRDVVSTTAPVRMFAEDCCSGLYESPDYADFVRYFNTIIEECLSCSHGTILVCTKLQTLSDIPEMTDIVPIIPSLDFFRVFQDYRRSNSAEALLNLNRCEELLTGLMNCDGLITFNSLGQILAYRVFFRPVIDIANATSKVVGGARRRAFEGLKSIVGEHLKSALFRSQDGLTLRHGS